MPLAPVILFVYNRPWHTRQTVEALQKNELAAESDLFIFADGPKHNASEECLANIAEVRNYIHTISGFKSITIEEAPKNKGLANSVISGVTKIINQFNKAIVVEDDIVTHPFFLRFMNEALDYYQNTEKIFAISATMEKFAIPKRYKEDIFLTYRFGSWGWATWNDRWNTIDWNVDNYPIIKHPTKKQVRHFCKGGADLMPMLQAQLQGNIDSWAIRMGYNISLQNRLCLRPIKSFVYNIGMDGSGIHCNDERIQFLPMYTPETYDVHLKDEIKTKRAITQNIQNIFINPPPISQRIKTMKQSAIRILRQVIKKSNTPL